MQGDGEAEFPSPRLTSRLPTPSFLFQRTTPLISIDINSRSSLLSPTVVRKILSPHMTGVDPACPGNSSRHNTFSVLLQTSAISTSSQTPLAYGPRQVDQLSANDCWSMKSKKPIIRIKIRFNSTRFIELSSLYPLSIYQFHFITYIRIQFQTV